MVATTWLPTAERVAGCTHTGGTLAGGPPRAVHHITYDALAADGTPPAFEAVRDYLARVGYEPHLMIDPITGRIAQFLPFNTSGYALEHPAGTPETNRMGSACIQVEWFFSPGVLRAGKRYATLADTPMLGMGAVLAVCGEYGIPLVQPMGAPTWTPDRDETVWASHAGHYGHVNVPNNTHTDPGPMPPLVAPAPQPVQEDEDMVVFACTSAAVKGQYLAGAGPKPIPVPTGGDAKALADAGIKTVLVSTGMFASIEAAAK